MDISAVVWNLLKPYLKPGRTVKVGRHTYGISMASIPFGGDVEIGAFCSFAEGVRLLADGDHRTDLVSTFPFRVLLAGIGKDSVPKGRIRIGNDVWVGMGAIILGKVEIGDGAVIGAGSVVVKDVLPYEVVAGNPARHIRFRFDDDTIAGLQKIRWWGWSDGLILSSLADFYLPVEKFIGKHGVV